MINCSLTPDQIRTLRVKISGDLLDILADPASQFDVKSYLRDLYNLIESGSNGNKNLALDYARMGSVIVSQLVTNRPTDIAKLLFKGLDLNELMKKNIEFADPNNGLNLVGEYVAPIVSEEVIEEIIKQEEEEIQQKTVENQISGRTIQLERLRPRTAVSTTINELLDPDDPSLGANPAMAYYTKFVKNVLREHMGKRVGSSELSGIDYPGVSGGLFITMMRYNQIPEGQLHPKMDLERGEDKNEYDNGFVYVITDQDGNPVIFDQDYKVSDTGKMIYYNTRFLPPKVDGKFILTNVKNVQNPKELSKNLGISELEAEKRLDEQFKSLEQAYEYLKANPTGSIRYAINGGSFGAVVNANATYKDPSTIDFQNAVKNVMLLNKQQAIDATGSFNSKGGFYLGVSGVGAPMFMKIKKISDADVNLIYNVLTKQLTNQAGQPVSLETRRNIIYTYLKPSAKDITIAIDAEKNRLVLKYKNEVIDLDNEQAVKNAIAKDKSGNAREYTFLTNKFNSEESVPFYNVAVDEKTGNAYISGVKAMSPMEYISHVAEVKVELESDNTIKQYNPYFTLVTDLKDIGKTVLAEQVPAAPVSDKKADIDNFFSINSQSILDNKKDIIANPSKYETSKKVGNITIEQTVDVAESGALTIMQFVNSNDKAIYLSNRIYVSSKGEVSSRVKRGGGIGFFKDESGVVTNESKERMLKLAETVKNYFPEIFARIEEYAKKYKGFAIETTKFEETVKKLEFIDAFDSFLYDKDLLSDADFVRITLHNAELAALDQSTTPVSDVRELKDAIVDRLRSGETITGTISRPANSVTAFEFNEAGKPTVKFYNRGAQPVDHNDINKKATLKLVGTVTTEDGREFKDVVEVYIGDKYVGNIQETDFKQSPKTEEAIAKAEPIVKEQEGKSSADVDVVSKILKNDDFLKRMRNKLDNQTNVRATAEQVRLAKEWYESSPLAKFIPFTVAFNVINTKTRGSIATWDQHGITLFKGSDYSDLYHEAWHGFTQTFLTKEQRDNLYAEARKNKGTFRSYKGREVAYENATREELEEKLAEDFREFMLSKGKKVNEKAPVKNKIFKLLLDILNYLFGKSTVQDIQDNSMGNPVISEMFEKLRVGDLSQYTFNQANAEFTLLNSTIEPLDPLMDSPGTISRQDAKELVDSVDSLIGELIDKLNDANDTKVFTRSLLLDEEGRTLAYKYVEEQLTNKLEELLVEHNSMAPDADRQEIDYKISLLSYALRNYGDSNNPFNTFGLVKYHGQTSEFLEFEDRLGDTAEDINVYERNEFDRKSGNETAMKALAGTSLLYTIRSLYAHDAEGNTLKNILGFPKLADFNRSWNRITNITEGSTNVDDIYKRLQDASEDYPIIKQFLNKIGSPSNLENSSVRLWSDIEKIMTMPRIGLVSLRVKVENSKPEGSNKVKKTVVLTATQSTGEYTKVGRKWDSEFAVATGPYISVNANNVNTLNVDKVLADFSSVNFENAFAFMKAIGMPLEESKVAKKGFMESGMLVEVREAHTKLAAIQNYHNSYSPTDRITITKPSEIFKDTKVKISLNEGVPMSDIIRARKLEQALQGSTTKYNAIQKFQLKWSDDFSDTTVSNAENENQYERSLRSTASQMVTKLNAANTETELTQDGVANADDLSMNHLSRRRNPFMKTSMFFNRLFDKKTGEKNSTVVKKTNKLTNARIELMNMSGVSRELTSVKGTIENSGISSSSADGVTKRLEDIYMMMLYGVNEATRHADKSTTYLYKVISADGKVHLIDIASFSETIGENSSVGVKAFVNQLTEYLGSEHERIRKLENGDPAGSVTVGKSSYYEVGSKLAIFDKILSTQTKAILDNVPGSVETAEQFQDYLNEEKNIDLKNAIEKEIAQYLFDKANTITEKLNSVNFFQNEQLVDELVKRMVKTKQAGYDKTESIFSISSERKKEIVNSIAIAYAANDWLHKYESTLLFYGDPALYDHSKDEFFKRNAGFSATGDIPRTDKSMIEYINAKLRENSFASKLGITPKAFGKTMSAAVMQDTATRSVYLDEYLSYAKEKEEARLRDLGASDEKIKEALDKLEEIFNDAYASMKEGDGQGWINFDAYRSLLLSLNKWSHYQEQLYQKVINNETVDVDELLQFFPVKKMQYWGPLKTDGLAVYGFHKYSLMPLIPNITAGTHMETLQRKMLEQGVDYAMFQSGSKINTITTDGKVDKFYNDNSNKEDMSVAFADPGYTFTKNNIFLDYFKDQLEVNDSYKPSVTFPTQLRSLIEEGLMENGVPTDWKPEIKDKAERIKAWNKETDKETSYNYRLLTAYESKLERLVELKKEKLRKEIGSNPEDLVKFIKRELTRKEMAEHSIDFIDYDAQKNKFKNSLDLSLMADSIERGLVAIVQKNIINQKVNGQSLVQVAGTGFEKANFRKPSKEEAKKYGQRGLRSYTNEPIDFDQKYKDYTTEDLKNEYDQLSGVEIKYWADSYRQAHNAELQYLSDILAGKKPTVTKVRNPKTDSMQVKIAMQGKFKTLLQTTEVKNLAREQNIAPIDALNLLLKDETWRRNNRDLITSVAVRIPTQGLNSMEFMEIVEFLPESSGNIIILPAEIVGKTGGDFDIDKMYSLFPNLKLRTKDDISTVEFETGDTIEGIENDILSITREILEKEENFLALITPNTTITLKNIAEKISEKLKGKKQKRSATDIFESEVNLEKHQSNNIGKMILGIIAVNNTFSTIFNRTGLILEPRRVVTSTEMGPVYGRQELELSHNKVDGKISLSNLYSADGIDKIADLISQMINGSVDVAKDDWIFDLQADKEAISKIVFMIQAGVPAKQVALFMSQPIIREYIKKQKMLRSKFNEPLGIKDPGTYYRITARDQILFDDEFGFDLDKKDFTDDKSDLVRKYMLWPAIEDIARSADKKLFSEESLEKNINSKEYTDVDRAVFAHFLEIEEMANGITQLTQNLNFDTSKTATLFEARTKLDKLNDLANGVSQESVDMIIQNSPKGKFKVQDFVVDLLKDMFPLRDGDKLNNHIKNELLARDKQFRTKISVLKKQLGIQNDEDLINKYRSDLIAFIFQQDYYKFDPNAKTYNGADVAYDVQEVKSLTNGAFVKDGVLYVDKGKIKEIFTSERYKAKQAWGYAVAPLDPSVLSLYDKEVAEALYFKYTYQREINRSIESNSFENISKTKEFFKYKEEFKDDANADFKAYESVLRDITLDGLNYHGHMFFGKRAYAKQIMAIKETNPELFEKYQFLSDLEIVTTKYGATEISNLRIAGRPKGKDIERLYDNLQELSDATVKKVKDSFKNAQLSALFQKMTHFALLQSGIDTASTFSLIPFVSNESYLNLVKEPYEKFLADKDTKALKLYDILFAEQYSEEKNKVLKVKVKAFAKSIDGISPYSRYEPVYIDVDAPNAETELPVEVATMAEEIYSDLGNKTQSENVEIPGLGNLKDVKYDPKTFWTEVIPEAKAWFGDKIIIAYRGKKTNTFLQNYRGKLSGEPALTIGNPFDFADETGTRKEQGVKSTKKFIEWMITGNNFGNSNATEEYRQAIIEDIKNGKLKNRPIIYYQEKGYATHATAIDYLINKYDWSKPTTSTTEFQGYKGGFEDKVRLAKDNLTNTIHFTATNNDLTENVMKAFASALAQSSDKQLVVFNEIDGRTKTAQGTNSVYRVMGEYAYGIITKKGAMPTTPAGKQNKTLMFTDETLEQNKEMIDGMINELSAKKAEGYKLLFDGKGYGQYMAGYNEYSPLKGKPDFEAPAPETFNYLSQQLFEKFGYINPNYLETLEGRRIVQSRQPVTDDEIFDLKKSCKLA